jgi:exopolysaccharide biosynthesis polyprenyl glycosylphosphotransferase
MEIAQIALGGFGLAVCLGLTAVMAASPIRRRIGHGLIETAIGAHSPADERRGGRVDLVKFSRADIERIEALRTEGPARIAKRAFDIALAIGLLAATAPLLVFTAIAIKLDSPGPVLYRQRRVGLDGREFEIFKFRSMRADAEKGGAQWARKNDDRITRVGRFIRRTRIDEIPQAINILRGEMSFVGPRPERPEFVTMLEKEIPNYHTRHRVKPGITGWAQVRHEYTASVEGARDKLSYDLFYVKHFSLLLDFLIVLMTIRVALLGIGSR